jgi:hypothetical protein
MLLPRAQGASACVLFTWLRGRPSRRVRDLPRSRGSPLGQAAMEGGLMVGIITARAPDYFGLLVAASVFALISAGVTAICIRYEERVLAWVWTAAYLSCGLAAAYFLWRLL